MAKKNMLKRMVELPVLRMKVPMWALVGAVGGLALANYQTGGMLSSKAPVAMTEAAPIMPSVSYGYDAYPPIRNQPYYDAMHTFGPADGDPVFYGVPGWM